MFRHIQTKTRQISQFRSASFSVLKIIIILKYNLLPMPYPFHFCKRTLQKRQVR